MTTVPFCGISRISHCSIDAGTTQVLFAQAGETRSSSEDLSSTSHTGGGVCGRSNVLASSETLAITELRRAITTVVTGPSLAQDSRVECPEHDDMVVHRASVRSTRPNGATVSSITPDVLEDTVIFARTSNVLVYCLINAHLLLATSR